MSLRDNLFVEEVSNDVTLFIEGFRKKRVLIFPPTNNYRRFLIHQFVNENFCELLQTFSIGQGSSRRTVVCYKSDVIRNPNFDGALSRECNGVKNSSLNMGVERPCSPSTSPGSSKHRQVKSTPAAEIYRPPAARRSANTSTIVDETSVPSLPIKSKQRRPDRAVYVPKARRNTCNETTTISSHDEGAAIKCKSDRRPKAVSKDYQKSFNSCEKLTNNDRDNIDVPKEDSTGIIPQCDDILSNEKNVSILTNIQEKLHDELDQVSSIIVDVESKSQDEISMTELIIDSDCGNDRQKMIEEPHIECQKSNELPIQLDVCSNVVEEPQDTKMTMTIDNIAENKKKNVLRNFVSDVLIISDTVSDKSQENIVETNNVAIVPIVPLEKKPKKVARTKSKPALPPASPLKVNRDECDWDSLFDDNGECLDPTLIEELTAAVGEVTIEQPKNVYKTLNRPVEVSSDEFAHVLEIYNFPSDFKTSDLAAVFSPFKNGGFELKWVDDTHCLGVFSSPLVAAEVLASDHQFVKTRPLSEATALSRTKARRSAEFLQPYRSRPETCAALARRLVTGALGVKLATAQQEREREKILLREARERRRLANKQREDVWEGIIAQK